MSIVAYLTASQFFLNENDFFIHNSLHLFINLSLSRQAPWILYISCN